MCKNREAVPSFFPPNKLIQTKEGVAENDLVIKWINYKGNNQSKDTKDLSITRTPLLFLVRYKIWGFYFSFLSSDKTLG